MPRVLSSIGPLAPDAGGDLLASAGVELRFAPKGGKTPVAELIELLQGCVATIAGGEPYTREVFAARPELAHIARFGVGFDAVDVAGATEAGVVLSTVVGTLDDAVADLTFGLILDVARGISRDDRRVRQGRWMREMTVEVTGKTLGIVGLGRIGRAVARRAGAFRMRVLATEPYPDRAFVAEHGITLAPLERLLAESDFVSLHAPLMPETEGLMNAERLALMRPGAFLINVARGRLVDEAALEAALRAGRIAGAGLDVRAEEPPRDTRFLDLDNVVLTPHVASNTVETRRAMARMAAENVARVLRGERPGGLINPEAWERRARGAG